MEGSLHDSHVSFTPFPNLFLDLLSYLYSSRMRSGSRTGGGPPVRAAQGIWDDRVFLAGSEERRGSAGQE
jgi:hypothetical protein